MYKQQNCLVTNLVLHLSHSTIMKLRLVICLIFFPLGSILAQQLDSVMLEDVVVYGLPMEKYLTGSSVQKIDSAFQIQNISSQLGDVLSFQLPVYFRSYGSGMVSGISLRGTSPQHTAVLWNGLNINSFSLGQADFSILPSIAFDEVKIHEGGGSARHGSGAFGGAVLLTSSSSKSASPLRFIQEVGSFGRYFTSLKGNMHAGRWAVSTTAYHVQSQNNFPIPGTNERQQHAAYHQEGVVEDIEYNWSSSRSLKLHYWYHQSQREIQPTMGQYKSDDEQQDRNHRLQIEYLRHNRLGIFNVNTGFTDDWIVFNGDKGTVFRWSGGFDHQYSFNNGWHTQVGVKWNYIQGEIRNYKKGNAKENRANLFASLQKDFNARLSLACNVMQPFVWGFESPILPYVGVEYILVKQDDQRVTLRSNASKNFRMPTLNDRYWLNAGSLDLLPETSYAAEGGLTWQFHSWQVISTFFTQRIDDWIQWVPTSKSESNEKVYKPRNVKQVQTKGLEIIATDSKKIREDIHLNIRLTYQLTESIIIKAPVSETYTLGKQLILTPKHTGSGYASLVWKTWSAAFETQYSGKRYTEASNSNNYVLPAFFLMDFSFSKYAIVGQHRFDLRISLRNIANKNYQLYSGRAQPGRSMNVQLVYQLNHH